MGKLLREEVEKTLQMAPSMGPLATVSERKTAVVKSSPN
jgi:hypothetical protein